MTKTMENKSNTNCIKIIFLQYLQSHKAFSKAKKMNVEVCINKDWPLFKYEDCLL